MLLQSSVLVLLCGCSGDDGEGAGGAGAGSGSCAPEIASIQAAIFVPKCGGTGCHGDVEPAASLDLSGAELEARLVDVPSATCDRTLVVPGNPELSFLYEKISVATPACGQPMPLGSALPADQMECVRAWIAGLSGGCETCGGAGCADLDSDPRHCGSCDRACPPTASCVEGECICPHDGTLCGDACAATQYDPSHCGGCDKKCPPMLVCSLGDCAMSCAAELTECNGGCVDTTNNPDHCGGCNQVCGATGTCQAGACFCGEGIDTQTDPKNCGGCGVACAQGQTCEAGACSCGTASVSFAQSVQPILTANCATTGCHKGVMPQEGLDLTAAKSYEALVGVAATQCNDGRKLVEPGKPEQSYVVDKIQNVDLCFGTRMPKLASLGDAQIETIVNWICAGAPDN
jgi:hypothetical protein